MLDQTKQPVHIDVCVRAMQQQDVSAAVKVHMAAFRAFFLTSLGPAFLEIFYREMISQEKGAGFVCEVNGAIFGFVIGAEDQTLSYRLLLKRQWLAFVIAALPALVKQPMIAPRLARALTYTRDRSSGSPAGLLMSISVLPEARGHGIGGKLVDAFLAEMRLRGVSGVVLTTDAVDNDAVNAFYRSKGFRILRTFVTPEGRLMNEFAICLIDEQLLTPPTV
jgi:ribosomal protein S18 acetylase RimI-like enzyme